MAYMNQEKKAKIAAALKVALKGTGVKYSLRVRNYAAICCTIKSAPIDFIANSNEVCGKDFYQVAHGFKPEVGGHSTVNPYHYKSHYSGKALQVIDKIIKCLYSADYYDNSDAMTDYFDTAYYVNIDIGCWNKPFVVTAK
jgi:hypothetical protein